MNIRPQAALSLGIGVIACSAFVFTQVNGQDEVRFGQNQRGERQIQQRSPGGKILVDVAQISCVHKIQVAAQSDGLIEQLLADEGSIVRKGDTLLVIDARIAEAELEVAQKQYEAAEMKSKQTANIEFSKKAYELAKEEFEAEKQLYLQRSSTRSVLSRKKLEAEKADFSIDLAEDEQEKARLDSLIAQEQVRAAEVKLGLYKVVAPYDGVIVERIRDQGEWIRAGEPVLRLVHLDEVKVEGYIPLNGISITDLVDARVDIRVDLNSNDVGYTGKIDFLSPEIDAGRVRFATRLENPKVNNTWILRDGMKASVEITPNR